jgi:hypothetical protein
MEYMKSLSLVVALITTAAGCESQEAPRVRLPVVVDASGVAATATDLGYTVILSRARTALRDLQFTTGGETHASLFRRIGAWLLPSAHAHPGHSAGGEVTGELAGPLVVDWLVEGGVVGQANLIVGRYEGLNFTFRRATATDVPAVDPLLGHTIHVEGTAAKDGRTVAFSAAVDLDEGTQLVGAPFEQQIEEGKTATLGLRLLTIDPADAKNTLWNGIDFFALAAAGETVAIGPGEASHNQLRRVFQVHDHYDMKKR